MLRTINIKEEVSGSTHTWLVVMEILYMWLVVMVILYMWLVVMVMFYMYTYTFQSLITLELVADLSYAWIHIDWYGVHVL